MTDEAPSPDVLGPLDRDDLFEPLSEATLAERKLLLLVSLTCLGLTWSDLIPTRVDALGIEISTADRTNLVVLLGLCLLYFLLAFSTYAATDIARWQVAKTLARRKSAESLNPVTALVRDKSKRPDDATLGRLSAISSDVGLGKRALQMMALRATFDVVVPLLVGLTASVSILAELLGLDGPFTLFRMAWWASPVGASAVAAGFLYLSYAVFRRFRGRRLRLPWNMRAAHHVMKIGKLFPFSPRLQQAFLRLGLRLHSRK